MKTFGIVYQPKTEEAVDLAHQTETLLRNRGFTVWIASAWQLAELHNNFPGADCVITFGGDGTVLRAGRLCAPHGVPILSVNFGKLGFLIEIQPEDFFLALERYLAGEGWIEERILIQTRFNPASGRPDQELAEQFHREFLALNDVVVSRGAAGRVITLKMFLDGDEFNTLIADGALVCTPTGSTAYSLAAGGPILDPQIEHLMFTPLAPHLGLRQSIVLPKHSTIRIEVESDHGPVVSIDGQSEYALHAGDSVDLKVAEPRAGFVRLDSRTYFYRTLAERLTRRILSGR